MYALSLVFLLSKFGKLFKIFHLRRQTLAQDLNIPNYPCAGKSICAVFCLSSYYNIKNKKDPNHCRNGF